MDTRTVHGITWQDDLAWMEPMKGARWNTFVRAEQTTWEKAVAAAATPEQLTLLTHEIKAAKQSLETPLFRAGAAAVGIKGTAALSWAFEGHAPRDANDLAATAAGVWAVNDCTLCFYKTGETKSTWCKKDVGECVAIVGGRCYGSRVKKILVSYKLVSWDALTGEDERVHYEEVDYRYNLYIVRRRSTAYLVRMTGPKQDAFKILEDGSLQLLEGISLESRRFVLGERGWMVWSGGAKASGGGSEAKASGSWTIRTRGRMPSLVRAVPESIDTRLGLLVTRWKGRRSLWHVRRAAPPVLLWEGYASLQLDPWDGTWLRIQYAAVPAVWHTVASPARIPYPDLPTYFRGRESSKRHIPYCTVSLAPHPTHVLVIGYGAYGSPTSMNTAHFAPLLARGWALAIGMWRGGGDHTPEWEDAGRLGGREDVLKDAEDVVRSAAAALGLGAATTWLYGRSAGGLWVGGLAAKYPGGELARGVYMEVPYLDVLRTTTNRTLPLTEIETDEFGLPDQRISDFAGMLRWSPMEMLVAQGKGTPGVAQIVRTGLEDNQVLAYESAKWIVRSRRPARGRPIFLAIQGDQGHFVHGNLGASQEAQDLALILKISSTDIR